MELNLKQNLEIAVEQRLELLLSPKVLQALKILNMSYTTLLDKIEKEAQENVMLDMQKDDSLLKYLRYLDSNKKIKKQVDFEEYPGMKNINLRSQSLPQALLEQLEIENPDEPYKNMCETLIENIDTRGYIKDYPKIKKEIEKNFDVSRATVDNALKIIQGFEPDGVGARNLKECLLIQVKEHNFENEKLQEIISKTIENHLEDLSKEKHEKISQSLGISKEGVIQIAQFIRENLEPYPGNAFGESAREIIPSFAIEQDEEGTYKIINLEKNYGPRLSLSEEYMKILGSKQTDAETSKYLKEKMTQAKELIENINRRHETSNKIMTMITQAQTPFLKNGNSWLRPLLQKHLAQEIGVHASTISRAVSQKYVQTPTGILPIKFLCQRDHKGTSVAKIQSVIKNIVEDEDENNPLSDEEIRNILNLQGIEIKRRTVAAYRKKANIPASETRGAAK